MNTPPSRGEPFSGGPAPESPTGPGPTPRPPRRLRYSGKNPRRFAEKYKERDPSKYATDVAKIIASGKTPAGTHRPVMVGEILARLAPKPGQTFVDCTLGHGGHGAELLARLTPGGRLVGLDVDPVEQPRTEARLRALGFGPEVFQVCHRNFAGIAAVLAELGWGPADGVLADLGVSSMQRDDPERGFTFKLDGPLDLRLNPQRGLSAAAWLARVTQEKLSRVLQDNADEPAAELLARELIVRRRVAPFVRTVPFARAIRDIVAAGAGPMDPAAPDLAVRRVFQALRIAVNEEFSALDGLLRALPACVRPGGRVAILTFHSGEDRRVKHVFREGFRAGIWSEIADEVGRPSSEEVHSNPRASSAKLRWAVRAEA